MAPRSTKASAKATTSSKAKTAKKRALPEEEGKAAQPAKRPRSSTVSGANAEVTASVAVSITKPVTKAAKSKAAKATTPIPEAPVTNSPDDQTAEATSTFENKTEAFKFAGAFELFSMNIEILNLAYAPLETEDGETDEAFHGEALYKAIEKYRTKKIAFTEDGEQIGGPNGKLTIPIRGAKPSLDDEEDDYDEEEASDGILTLTAFQQPYCGGPIKINLIEVIEQSQESLDSEIETDLGRPEDDSWNGPGISASLEIQDYQVISKIQHSSGKFCMRPLWKGIDANGKVIELFEGSLTFHCIFDRVWLKRGGKGYDEEMVFWAVRGQSGAQSYETKDSEPESQPESE